MSSTGPNGGRAGGRAWNGPPHGHVLLIGLNRPAKRNAFTEQMISELSAAYALWGGVLFADGDHFTGGLTWSTRGPHDINLWGGATFRSPSERGGATPWAGSSSGRSSTPRRPAAPA